MGEMTRGALIFTAAAGAAGVGVGVLADRYGPQGPPEPRPGLVAGRTDREIPLDPDAEEWTSQEALTVPVLAQQIAPPTLADATLDDVELTAMHNVKELAVLVRFKCADREDLPGLGSYADAVAMQLPLVAGGKRPPITMGGPGQAVHIVRWSSIWQRDAERGRSRVETIYPNTVRDVSPESVLPAEAAGLYSPGRAVGNPVSALKRAWPVEEAFAEGFGTLTPLPEQRARAGGRHRDEHWNVVLAVPLDRRPSGDLISDQPQVPVAFALWVGAHGNRGSRKHYTDWIQCTLA